RLAVSWLTGLERVRAGGGGPGITRGAAPPWGDGTRRPPRLAGFPPDEPPGEVWTPGLFRPPSPARPQTPNPPRTVRPPTLPLPPYPDRRRRAVVRDRRSEVRGQIGIRGGAAAPVVPRHELLARRRTDPREVFAPGADGADGPRALPLRAAVH